MKAYRELESRFHRLYALRNALGVLQWDLASMMPAGGAAARAEQMAALNVVCHGVLADPAVGDLLDEADDDRANLDDWQHANLAEMRRQWAHATALNPELVEALSKASSACEQIWRKARPADDFALVKPALARAAGARARGGRRPRRRSSAARPTTRCSTNTSPAGAPPRSTSLFDDLAAFLPGFREARAGAPGGAAGAG